MSEVKLITPALLRNLASRLLADMSRGEVANELLIYAAIFAKESRQEPDAVPHTEGMRSALELALATIGKDGDEPDPAWATLARASLTADQTEKCDTCEHTRFVDVRRTALSAPEDAKESQNAWQPIESPVDAEHNTICEATRKFIEHHGGSAAVIGNIRAVARPPRKLNYTLCIDVTGVPPMSIEP